MNVHSPMSGRVWRTPAVAIEEVRVPAGVRLSGHGHDVPHLCFVEAGYFSERDAGRDRTVEPGTLRSSPVGDEHELVFRTDSRCLLVLIHGDPAAVAPRLPQERRFLSTSRLKMLGRCLSASLSHSASPLELEMVVLELLAAASPKVRAHRSAPPPPWLQRVRDRLRDVPSDRPSTIDVAMEAGYHPVYVARAFRQFYGVGIGEYARLARAEYARALLAESGVSLAEVALHAGYSDQSHLTRSMRGLLNTTPAEIRSRRGGVIQVSSIQDRGDVGS